MKSLILRCVDRKENLSIAIAAWRNMARADGVSPAQLFYNRRMKQLLPIQPARAKNAEINIRARDEAAERAEKNSNKTFIRGQQLLKPHSVPKHSLVNTVPKECSIITLSGRKVELLRVIYVMYSCVYVCTMYICHLNKLVS